ncbi:hypothetical protein RHS03_06309, partial [Rhizoctonia solani]
LASMSLSFISLTFRRSRSLSFFEGHQIPAELEENTLQVTKFAGYFLNMSGKPPGFCWDSFKDAINHLPDAKIAFGVHDSTTFHQQNSRDTNVLDQVAHYIVNVVAVGVKKDLLKTKFDSVFESSSYSNVCSGKVKSNSGYTYGIVFAFPSGRKIFDSVIITIDVKTEEVKIRRYGLISSIRGNYMATITAARLTVDKTFEAPDADRYKC